MSREGYQGALYIVVDGDHERVLGNRIFDSFEDAADAAARKGPAARVAALMIAFAEDIVLNPHDVEFVQLMEDGGVHYILGSLDVSGIPSKGFKQGFEFLYPE